MKREIYKATASGNEYLLSFTARRLMANLREVTLDHANECRAGKITSHSWERVSEAREALVKHISQLESDNIELREAIKFHQTCKPDTSRLTNRELLREVHLRFHQLDLTECRTNSEQNTSTLSSAGQSESRPADSSTLKTCPSTLSGIRDTADNSSAPGAAESGQYLPPGEYTADIKDVKETSSDRSLSLVLTVNGRQISFQFPVR